VENGEKHRNFFKIQDNFLYFTFLLQQLFSGTLLLQQQQQRLKSEVVLSFLSTFIAKQQQHCSCPALPACLCAFVNTVNIG